MLLSQDSPFKNSAVTEPLPSALQNKERDRDRHVTAVGDKAALMSLSMPREKKHHAQCRLRSADEQDNSSQLR
jgi:hypothetical protein